MNIYEKMSKATESINKVTKNLKVGFGQNQYKAVGEADVLEAVKPIEIQYGIYSYPFSRTIIATEIFVTSSEYNGKKTEKNNLWLRVETVYRFVNIETPEEFVDIIAYGDGLDSQDKAPGKAMTYSDKYALLKAYKIETGDDPDQKASQDMRKPKDMPPKRREATPEPSDAEKKAPLEKKYLDSLLLELERTGVKAGQINKKYKVLALDTLTFEQYVDAMTGLQNLPDKKKTDLGL